MNKRSLFAKLLIMLLCFALLFSGCKKSDDGGKDEGGEPTTPKAADQQLSYSADKTLGALLSNGMASSVFQNAEKMGKVTVEYRDVFTNELYIDSANKYIADFLEVNADGEEVKGEVYYQNGALAVLIPELLGDDALGLDFNTLQTDLENSDLWGLLGVNYEDLLKAYDIDMDRLTSTVVDTLDSLGSLENVVSEAAKDVSITSENKKVTVNGEEVDAIVVTVKLTSADVEKMLLAYYDWLEEIYGQMMKDLDDSIGNVDLEDMLAVDLESMFDEYQDDIKDTFSEVDLTLDCVVNINAQTEYMMTLDLDVAGTVDGEEGAVRVDLNLGKDPSTSNKYTLALIGESDGEVLGRYDLELSKTSNGSTNETSLVVTSTEVVDGADKDQVEELFNATISYNEDDSKYSLSVSADGDTVTFEGVYKYTDKVFELSIDKVIAEGAADISEISGLVIRVEALDQVPQMPAYQNILQMSQDELTEFFNRFA